MLKNGGQHYTWWGNSPIEFGWKNKQEAIDFVMEGCIHDIVNNVTGKYNSTRGISQIEEAKHKLDGSSVFSVKWVDITVENVDELIFNPIKYDETYSIETQPSLSEILRERPFLSKLIGITKEDKSLNDILARFNFFTPIEHFKDPYLSSGQKQVLSLITAVRRAPLGSLILVDEPEISLHVTWQERLVEQLHAPLGGSRLLITTHSPDIVVRHRHLCTTLEVNEDGDFYRT